MLNLTEVSLALQYNLNQIREVVVQNIILEG